MRFPSDWQKESWEPGEIHLSGGNDYLVPFLLDVGPEEGYVPLVEPEEADAE